MKLRLLQGGCLMLVLWLPLTAAALPADVPVLAVEQAGGAQLLRDGSDGPLRVATALRAGDVISAAQQPVQLRLHRNGRIELGQGAVLAIEKLPHSSFASELRSVLNLRSGYLHVVWKRPGSSETWPLLLYFGDMLLALSSGEYFFEAAQRTQLCIAGGEVSWSSDGALQRLQGPACYLLEGGPPSPAGERRVEDFIAMRAQRRLPDAEVITREPPVPALDFISIAAPAPAVAATPVPLLPAATPAAGAAPAMSWVVNASSVSDLPTAQREMARLRAAGYEPVLAEALVQGRRWYRVQVAGGESAESARLKAREIERKLGLRGVWIARP